MNFRGSLGGIALGLGALSLFGCSTIEQFGDRAVNYNLEAERSQDTTLFLNIIRASFRRPLEFSGVQTASGTDTVTVGPATLSFPFGPHQMTSNSVGLGGQLTVTPTFNVSVLDTQEFFQGLLSPVTMANIDFYNQERYSRSMLFNLFFSRIVIKQTLTDNKGVKKPVTVEIPNNVGNDNDLDRFQMIIDYLINLGLTTEPKDNAIQIGPLVPRSDVKTIADLARAVQAKLDVKSVNICDLSPSQAGGILLANGINRSQLSSQLADLEGICSKKRNKIEAGDLPESLAKLPVNFNRVQTSEKDFDLCFESRSSDKTSSDKTKPTSLTDSNPSLGEDIICGGRAAKLGDPRPLAPRNDESENFTSRYTSMRSGFINVTLGARLTKNLDNARLGTPIEFGKPLDELDLVPRSTEGIIYYLGEVLRRQHYPDPYSGAKRVVQIHYGPPVAPTETRNDIPSDADQRCPNDDSIETRPVPNTAKDDPAYTIYKCEPLFTGLASPKGATNSSADSFVSVDYDVWHYGLDRDSTRVGRTYQVLNIVTQLIALHKIAKDVPTSTVFTVISPP